MLTLLEIKDHLRIEHSNTTHDDLLNRLALASAAWACSFLNVESLELFDTDSSPPASPFLLPEDLKSGLLLHVEAMFSRDDVMMDKLMKTAEWLVMPYRQEMGV